jgi:hypothetical protein
MKYVFPYRRLSLLKMGSATTPPQALAIRPLVVARLMGPNGRSFQFRNVLVDSGALHTVFPYDYAPPLGVQPRMRDDQGNPHTLGWRGLSFAIGFGTVEIHLEDANGAPLQWRAEVGFSKAPLGYQLLGQQGALEYFDATFRFGDLQLELEPNRFLPTLPTPTPDGE